jgi:hypothetical protein
LLHLRATASIPPACALTVVGRVSLRLLLLWGLGRAAVLHAATVLLAPAVMRALATWHLLSCLVADGNQECGDVFAVLSRLLERRAGAMRRDALSAQADRDLIWIRVRTFDASLRTGIVQVDLVHDLAFLVIEPAEKSASSE